MGNSNSDATVCFNVLFDFWYSPHFEVNWNSDRRIVKKSRILLLPSQKKATIALLPCFLGFLPTPKFIWRSKKCPIPTFYIYLGTHFNLIANLTLIFREHVLCAPLELTNLHNCRQVLPSHNFGHQWRRDIYFIARIQTIYFWENLSSIQSSTVKCKWFAEERTKRQIFTFRRFLLTRWNNWRNIYRRRITLNELSFLKKWDRLFSSILNIFLKQHQDILFRLPKLF